MHTLLHLDKKQHGTPDFPAEYYYVDSQHPRYQMSFHWHNEWELLRVLEGTFQIHIDDAQYLAESGDIFLIRGGVLHGGFPQDCVYECFTFDLYGLFRTMDMVKKSLRPFYRQVYLPQCSYPCGTDMDFSMSTNKLMNAFRFPTEPACQELVAIGALSALFAGILQKGQFTIPAANGDNSNHRVGQIKSVLEYIEQHYGTPLTLDMLAEVAGMNPKYFCRVFQKLTHQSPMEYVNFFRIEQAAFMLGSTDSSITAIGSECGFAESSYFTKVFKKYKDMTPKEYRNSITLP